MKRVLSDLAFMGGKPEFSECLHVGKPNIGDRVLLNRYINDIMDRRWLTNQGRYVQILENDIARLLGAKHCIAMCNGTIALEIAIRALGLSKEVIVPSFTFIATAHSLKWQEITPVFCDIDPKSHNIDPAMIERMITPNTTGIIGVHLWGRPCVIEQLEALAKKHHLKLLFDASHAFACSHSGKMIGGFGDAEVFSFHATKFFNTGEGGAIVTNNDELAEKIRLMKNFGFSGHDNVIYIGTNGKMNEISAAIGLSCIANLDAWIDHNYNNYQLYQSLLGDIPGITLIRYDQKEKCNYQYIVLEIDEQLTDISRDKLVKILHTENIIARRYFYPGCHAMEPYISFFPHAGMLLPQTNSLVRKVMSLPTGTAIGKQEITKTCGLIRFIIQKAKEINEELDSIRE